MTEQDNGIVKKKRGRKPKNQTQSNVSKDEEVSSEEISTLKENKLKVNLETNEVKVPKKRGRKPKIKTEEDNQPKIPKKRGRKPKPKLEQEVKIPKKRGRKPKDKYNISEKTNIVNIINEENIILHLPINSNKLNNKHNIENNLLKYTPILTEPSPYEPQSDLDSSLLNNEEIVKDKTKEVNNKLKLVIQPVENTQILLNKHNTDVINNENNENNDSKESLHLNIGTTIAKENKEINNIKEKYDEILNNYNKKRNLDLSNNNNKIGRGKITPIFYQYDECNKRKQWPSEGSFNCLWDFHKFEGRPYGLPIKKVDNTVYMFGNFCCPQCAAAYNFANTDQSDEMWERYSLLNWLYSDELDDVNDTFKISCSPLTLKCNGGSLSIEEFREINHNKTKDYKIVYPPVISMIPVMEEINIDINRKKKYVPVDKETIDKASNDFKLKRTKPLPNYKNTLESCMLLKYV